MKTTNFVFFAVIFVLLSCSVQAALTDQIYDFWKFDETTGTVLTGSINGVNGTPLAGVTLAANGIFNKSINLTVNTAVANFTKPTINASGMTFATWFKGSQQSAANILIWQTSGDFEVFFNSSSAGKVVTLFGAARIQSPTTIISDGLWHLLVGGWNATHIFVSVDGETPSYNPFTYLAPTGQPKIGTAASATGLYDSYGIWNRPLAAAEIQQLYQAYGNLSSSVNSHLTVTANSYNGLQLTNFTAVETNSTTTITNTTTTGSLAFGAINATLYTVSVYANSSSANFTTTVSNVLGNSTLAFDYGLLNLTATNRISGAAVSNFTATVSKTDGVSLTQYVANGNGKFYLNSGNYTVVFDSPGFALNTTSIMVNNGINSYNFALWTTNSINLTFLDANNKGLVPGTMTIDFISTAMSQTNTTTTGELYVDLLSPATYQIRARVNGYAESSTYLAVSNRSTYSLTIYMQNASQGAVNISLPIVDSATSPVSGAIVRVQKYDVATNTYLQQSALVTDNYGKVVFAGFLFAEYYRFVVEYPAGTTVLTSTPAYLTTQTMSPLIIPLNAPAPSGSDKAQGITASTSYNNATMVASYSWNDANAVGTQYCMYIYSQQHNVLHSSCSYSQSGQTLIFVNNTVYKYILIQGTATIDGIEYVLSSTVKETPVLDFGKSGILLVFIVTAAFIFMFRSDPIVAIMSVPIPVTFATMFGFTGLSAWIPVVVWIICATVAYLLRYS